MSWKDEVLEITRLRAEVERLLDAVFEKTENERRLEAEVERLRAALDRWERGDIQRSWSQ